MFGWTLAVLSPDGVIRSVRGDRALSSVEGLALTILGRFREYEAYEKPDGTDLEDFFEADERDLDFGWSLVRAATLAMAHHFETRGGEMLDRLVNSVSAPAEVRAVSALLLCIHHADADRYEDALEAINRLTEEDIQWPVLASAALHLQQSLRHEELGDRKSAHSHCVRAGYLLHTEDTLSSYREGASAYITGSDVGAVVQQVKEFLQVTVSRNISVFESMTEEGRLISRKPIPRDEDRLSLRYKLLSSVAAKQGKELFERKVRDRSSYGRPRVLIADDTISRDLHAVWLCSQLSGDLLDVQWSSELLGRERMVRREDSVEDNLWSQGQGVQLLRKSASLKGYSQAIGMLREEGSLSVLHKELRWALLQLPKVVNRPVLEAIKSGAVLLDEDEASSVARTLLSRPVAPFQSHGGGWYSTREPLWNAISALTLEVVDGSFISSAIRRKFAEIDSVTAQRILPVVSRLNWSLVDSDERKRWIQLLSGSADEQTTKLREAVLCALIENGDRDAVSLLERTLGDQPTLTQSGTLVDLHRRGFSDLLTARAPHIVNMCRSAITATIKEASRGAYSFGEVNEGLIAAIISIDFPEGSAWEELCSFLRQPEVSAHKKDPVFSHLARRFEDVPEFVRLELSSNPGLLKSRAGVSLHSRSDSELSGPRLRFLSKAAAISGSEILSDFVNLAKEEEVSQRIEAARSAPAVSGLLGPGLVFGFLLGLLADESPLVRAAAAESLAYFASTSGGSSIHSVNVIGEQLMEGGVAVPFGVLRGLKMHGLPDEHALSGRLKKHLSRTIKVSRIPRVRRICVKMMSELNRV
ncbi:hypothetical protein ACPCVO_36525 [Streptomyces umbrinus]|uniref:hypothetical protein n=1 Tax=Streptomyces umbrinus TaxID=67370 RepID=UPI003C2FAD58